MVVYSIGNTTDWDTYYSATLTSADSASLNGNINLSPSNFPDNKPKQLNGSTFNGNNNTITITTNDSISWSGVFDISLAETSSLESKINDLGITLDGTGSLTVANGSAVLFGFRNTPKMCKVNINGLLFFVRTVNVILSTSSSEITSYFWPNTGSSQFDAENSLLTATKLQIGEPNFPIKNNRLFGSIFSYATIWGGSSTISNSSIYLSSLSGSNGMMINNGHFYRSVEPFISSLTFSNVYINNTIELGLGSAGFIQNTNGVRMTDVTLYKNYQGGDQFPGPSFAGATNITINRMFIYHSTTNTGTGSEFVNINTGNTVNNFGSSFQPTYTSPSKSNITYANSAQISNVVDNNTVHPWMVGSDGFSLDVWTFTGTNLPIITALNTSPWTVGDYLEYTGNPQLDITLLCFIKGTKILTVDGYVLIEDLKVGNTLITARGTTKIVNCHYLKTYTKMYTLYKDCFEKGKPFEDLVITADHAIKLDDKLHHARCLPFDSKIISSKQHVELYHIETEDYMNDMIFANGIEAETWGRTFRGKVKWDCIKDECVLTRS